MDGDKKLAQFIKDRFIVSELRKIGFLTTEKTPKEIAARVCQFFDLKNIYMYDFIMSDKHKTVKANIKTFSEN